MPRSRPLIAHVIVALSIPALGVIHVGCGAFNEGLKDPPPMHTFEWGEEEEKVEEEKPVEPPKPAEPVIKKHVALNAVLWTQTAAEYKATATQSFALARIQLDKALGDKTWTASLEQEAMVDFADKPPAIIVDVDETVLDNSPYQARMVADDDTFKPDSWNAWANEKKALPIPGALEFAQYAASKGVTVFYVTNRDKVVEDATRANLEAHGFPLKAVEEEDVILTKNDKEVWNSSDKTMRRRHVAARYRVLLLVGDNLGDFVGNEYKSSVLERDQIVASHASKWGKRWIVLPNALYGSWESALFGHDYKKSPEEINKARWNALDPKR